jgi:CRISP-associated protein Cas1
MSRIFQPTCKVGVRSSKVLRTISYFLFHTFYLKKMHLKRTLYFGTPAYLKKQHNQLVIERPEQANATVPIENIGVIVLDCFQITLTTGLMSALVANNVALIQCDEGHLPVGLLLPLHGNVVQTERYTAQLRNE